VRNRDPLFLLAAVLLHALAVGAVWTNASILHTNVDVSTSTPDERLEFDVDLADEPAKALEAPPQPIAHVTTAHARPERFAPRGKPLAASEKDEAPIAEVAPSSTGSAETAVEVRPPPVLVPGLDGKPIWALPGILPPAPALGGAIAAIPAPVVPGAPPASTGPLAVALDYLASGNPPKPNVPITPIQHFPAAGTLASALASEVRGSSTPPNSDGIFELVVNAKGQLISVQVLAADPLNRKEWERVAHSIAQRFSGQTFPLPDIYARGSRIRVAVQSRLTMPDGTAHGVPMPLPKIPGLPSERDIRVDTLDDQHRAGGPAAGLPPTQLAAGLSFDMDLANIGAKRRRIVHTRISAAPLASATSQGAAAPQR
jgi:hypothetical protein